ncbi:hypothetical protein RA20_18900 [Leisingera sp. ANG-Vp]|nr:hypothetical protein RA20_18900 [Leisingera sp. ANG-Vp]
MPLLHSVGCYTAFLRWNLTFWQMREKRGAQKMANFNGVQALPAFRKGPMVLLGHVADSASSALAGIRCEKTVSR